MSPFKRKFEEIQVGDSATIHKQITEEDVNKFVAMTGDNNPLHVDPLAARRSQVAAAHQRARC